MAISKRKTIKKTSRKTISRTRKNPPDDLHIFVMTEWGDRGKTYIDLGNSTYQYSDYIGPLYNERGTLMGAIQKYKLYRS